LSSTRCSDIRRAAWSASRHPVRRVAADTEQRHHAVADELVEMAARLLDGAAIAAK